MKLRWKYFLILIAASLVPLLTVTLISQKASRRLGETISESAKNNLTETISQEMVRATRNYADLINLGGFASEQVLRLLAARAELALILPPPPDTEIYYAADFEDPDSAPKDMAASDATVLIRIWSRHRPWIVWPGRAFVLTTPARQVRCVRPHAMGSSWDAMPGAHV